MADLSGLVESLKLANYERVAVQVADSQLESSIQLLKQLTESLPKVNVSLLGDSVTECCLDETSAEHYGSDCIVKIGHCCWFASQRLPSYFIDPQVKSVDEVMNVVRSIRETDSSNAIFLFVDSMDQGVAVSEQISGDAPFLVCCSPAVSYPGSNKDGVKWFTRRPFTSLEIRVVARHYQKHQPEYPRVVGRLVFRSDSGSLRIIKDHRELSLYLDNPSTRFVCTGAGSLFSRLVNRFGTQKGRVSSCDPSASMQTDSNYIELLRRYRGVEAVKNASCVGLVVTHCAASDELFRVRDLLSLFLRSQGKDVFMFSVNKADGVKLGNFVDIDCFVIMSCPESEYFESNDLMADCVSPFEALVAMESLDWGDYVITDYDEMLSKMVVEPAPRTPRTPRRKLDKSSSETTQKEKTKIPPAKIEMGLRGIPSRYVSEPAGQR